MLRSAENVTSFTINLRYLICDIPFPEEHDLVHLGRLVAPNAYIAASENFATKNSVP